MKKLLLIMLCLFLFGCASVSFNPDTGEVRYFRIGDQKVNGFEMVMKDGTKIKLKGQESQAEAMTEAIKTINRLVP